MLNVYLYLSLWIYFIEIDVSTAKIQLLMFHRCLSGVKPRSSSCNRLPSNNSAAQASKEEGKKLQVEQTGAENPLSIQQNDFLKHTFEHLSFFLYQCQQQA